MALRALKMTDTEDVEAYYEWLIKLANGLTYRPDDEWSDTCFRAGLPDYLRVATTGMAKKTLISSK